MALSCDSTLRFLESEETETVKDFWPSLDWPGLVLAAEGVDFALSPASPARFLKASPVIETTTSSDIRSSRIRCRGRC